MSQRTPFVGGNFKCTGTANSLTALINSFNDSIGEPGAVEVVVSPGTAYLGLVKSVARRGIRVAAQNCYHKGGAFTGEVSVQQVKDMGIEHVIIGHSERRHIFGETDDMIRKKVGAALQQNLCVILCVGETLQEREKGETQQVCFRQLKEAVAGLSGSANWDNIVIAYEPVWAIGTGKVATPDQAQEVISMLRSWLSSNVTPSVASRTRIIYGGSVNTKNCAALWNKKDIDGFLVGGASTKPEFSDIVGTVAQPKSKL